MTKIKTAQATVESSRYCASWEFCDWENVKFDDVADVVIVHGLTEAEVHEAAALLEKSKEVCEWYLSENQHGEYDFCSSCDAEYQMRMPTFCPSCGRRAKISQ